jgi:acyl-CoA thioester hydrolase
MEIESNLYEKHLSIRWSDLDPNFHVRHSVYYDIGAQQRIEILHSLGLTTAIMEEQNFGPVIFREECIFKREIRLTDHVVISARLAKLSPDASRWTIQHEFLAINQKVLAVLTVDGAWMDTNLRKLITSTPRIIKEVFESIPRIANFNEAP